jgi:hypothetical protein
MIEGNQARVSRAGSRLPRITRLLALAVRFEGLLRDGTVRDYAELARLGGASRAPEPIGELLLSVASPRRNLSHCLAYQVCWMFVAQLDTF